jgi:hypothetical protein
MRLRGFSCTFTDPSAISHAPHPMHMPDAMTPLRSVVTFT